MYYTKKLSLRTDSRLRTSDSKLLCLMFHALCLTSYVLCFLLVFPGFSSSVRAGHIPFQYVVIDSNARGHREVGDVDGDGLNDIVAVNSNKATTMLVWYEYPSWIKHNIREISSLSDYTAYRACDMELADIDGDGDLDLVGRIGKPGDDVQGINLWFENPRPGGDPGADIWKRHDIGGSKYVKDIEVDDFDGDGKLDVVVRTHDDLHFWLQDNSDSWTKISVRIHKKEGMDVGDLDRDGDPDVALGGYWIETPADPRNGKWVEHNIDGKWWKQSTGDWRDNCSKVCVADMNEDGRLDVLISSSEKAGYPVSWYEASADPKNGNWTEHRIGDIDKCHTLKAADMDNDGDVDVIAAEMPNIPDEAPYPVAVFINKGNALSWEMQKLANTGNYSAQIGDIGNDGDIDIVGLRNHNRKPIEMWENKTSDNEP